MSNWLSRIRSWFQSEPTPPAAPPTHGMDALCQQYQATYIRDVFDSEVQLTLIRNDATLAARGPNTAAALESLTVKAHKCWGPLNA